MSEQTLEHPDQARLAAFGRGILDHDEMAEVETHLAACDSCCQVLSSLPDDEFVASLRTAQNYSVLTASFWGAANPSATSSETDAMPHVEGQASLALHDPAPTREHEATLPARDLNDPETPDRVLEWKLPAELANHPRYRIQKRLGIGGMGTVYLAEHRLMDRSVALKVVRRDLVGNEALVERFRREVKAAARLAMHPNIVTAYDAEQAGDFHFLVMEFVDGADLARVVQTQGPLPFALACETVKQAAEGLEHAYQHGMVHRDIKPQNLMRTPDGQVKILDFGLARFASEALPDLMPAVECETESGVETTAHAPPSPITLTDMVLGTADYMAPEQASAPRSADIRADIYSLGCTLYYLLAGHPPFPDGTMIQKLKAHSEQVPRPLTEIRPDVPTNLERIVHRMMAKDRSLRFQRPSDVAEALVPFANSKAANVEFPDLHLLKEVNAHPVDALSGDTETENKQPSVKSQSRTRGPRVRMLAIVALLVGSLGLFWVKPPDTPAAEILPLLIGYLGFFGMEAAGWPVAALFSLLIGFIGFLRLEPPGWPWAAHLCLLLCCMGALRMITVRQLVYALLFLLVGHVWVHVLSVILLPTSWQLLLLLLLWLLFTGVAGPFAIITFRQLDGLAPVRKTCAWACLAMLIAACAVGIAFAWGHYVDTKVQGEGILLIENDSLSLIRAPSTGRLVSVRVRQGDRVARGDEIGRISQGDLMDAIREGESKLNDLRREDKLLTQLEKKERENREAAIVSLNQAVNRAQNDSSENKKTAERKAELQQELSNAEISRQRSQFERRLKITQQETKLDLDRKKLETTSRIVSNADGVVSKFLARDLVYDGTPLVLLHAARPQRGVDHSDPLYDAIVFVPAIEGRKVEVGYLVQVFPATINREDYGFIYGRVSSVGQLPATKLTLEEALGNPELAGEFLNRYRRERLLLVKVKLEDRAEPYPTYSNRFRWSTAYGPGARLKTGTMCQAAIVIWRRRLIREIIPWIAKFIIHD